ncbi:kinase binding protein CGI-121-domain-containing protein [Crepidotus variabilis]|uniref:EKC/KEOPS complex subunit CGI121 n=1 Tax=Crepidotus variabilis TaxID=179855 RepID=A0A9P6ELX5_9AGAR|nr:kinase binding protein CGI-121-domain-containing protein [Crepidotus variabilis]
MESIQYPQFDLKRSKVHIALFKNVSNSGQVKSRIVAAATAEGDYGLQERAAVNFAFVEARLITSRQHIETAIYQAILAEEAGTMLTKTVHSEILYFLNPTHNISEAIKRYGISTDTQDLILVRIDEPNVKEEAVEIAMKSVIQGNIEAFSALDDVTDWMTVKKYHKLSNEVAIAATRGNPAKEKSTIDTIVTSSVAMKNVMQ